MQLHWNDNPGAASLDAERFHETPEHQAIEVEVVTLDDVAKLKECSCTKNVRLRRVYS